MLTQKFLWKSGPTYPPAPSIVPHKIEIQPLNLRWSKVTKLMKLRRYLSFVAMRTEPSPRAGIQANQCSADGTHGLHCSLICFTGHKGHEVDISVKKKKQIKARKVSSVHYIYCINYNYVLINPIFCSFWSLTHLVPVGHIELNLHLVPSPFSSITFSGAGGLGARKLEWP